MSEEYILKMEGIEKNFPGTKALASVDLKVRKGTIHAIMGENGAGKSTLMKTLLGIYSADRGTIEFKGKQVKFSNPNEALTAGLAMVHQELAVVLDRTVAENFFLGRELVKKGTHFLDKKAMIVQTGQALRTLNIEVNPKEQMRNLNIAQMQLCEIAKAVSSNADLIIMDEPTSSITEKETEKLFEIIYDLKAKGITIIYISHKMDEIFKISDEISVYRDGHYINTVKTKKTTNQDLISMMTGRKLENLYPKSEAKRGKEILRVEKLSSGKMIRNVSFSLHRGEILSFAGLVGAGRSEIMETIYGLRKKTGGEVYVNGEKCSIKCPRDAIRNGIAFLTEDRKESGCFLGLSIGFNISVASLSKLCYGGIFLKKRLMNEKCDSVKDILSIKMTGLNQAIGSLSGGNQQKALIARWLMRDADILIMDEPTRGIDVGAKAAIYQLMCDMAKEGKAIIMISSEMPEVIGMSDRVLVVSEGTITGELQRDELTQSKILSYTTLNAESRSTKYGKEHK